MSCPDTALLLAVIVSSLTFVSPNLSCPASCHSVSHNFYHLSCPATAVQPAATALSLSSSHLFCPILPLRCHQIVLAFSMHAKVSSFLYHNIYTNLSLLTVYIEIFPFLSTYKYPIGPFWIGMFYLVYVHHSVRTFIYVHYIHHVLVCTLTYVHIYTHCKL